MIRLQRTASRFVLLTSSLNECFYCLDLLGSGMGVLLACGDRAPACRASLPKAFAALVRPYFHMADIAVNTWAIKIPPTLFLSLVLSTAVGLATGVRFWKSPEETTLFLPPSFDCNRPRHCDYQNCGLKISSFPPQSKIGLHCVLGVVLQYKSPYLNKSHAVALADLSPWGGWSGNGRESRLEFAILDRFPRERGSTVNVVHTLPPVPPPKCRENAHGRVTHQNFEIVVVHLVAKSRLVATDSPLDVSSYGVNVRHDEPWKKTRFAAGRVPQLSSFSHTFPYQRG